MAVQIRDTSLIEGFKEILTEEDFELHERLKDEYLDNFLFDMPSIYEGFNYKVEEKDIVVTGYEPDAVKDGKLTIPMIFDGILYGEDGFKIGNDVLELDLGRTLVLGSEVFNGTALKSVTGKYLAKLGNNTFSNCVQLRDIDFPVLTSIGDETFKECNNLIKVVLPSLRVMGDGVFSGCEYLEECDVHGVRMAGGNTGRQEAPKSIFSECKRLAKLDISGALTLGERALYGCISLKELNLRLCRSFESYALGYCESLETLYLDNIMGFKESALEGCVSLSTINYYGPKNQWEDVMIESEVELNVLKNVTVNANYKDPE